jgi:pyruvate/2-oxoacid:ferredoxin oxidoreductase alpha subunit
MDVTLPDIQGATDAKQSESSEKEKEATVEQAHEMDLPTSLPIDETLPSRDVKEKQSQPEKEAQAEDVNKKSNSAKRSAILQKAREAKAEKRRLMKATSAEGATEVMPDAFKDIQKEMQTMGSQYKSMMEILQDLQQKIGSQAALIQNGVPLPTPVHKREEKLPSQSETVMEVENDHQAFPASDLRMTRKRERSQMSLNDLEDEDDPSGFEDREYLKQMERYAKKNKKALEGVFYQNKQMEDRAEADPTLGRRAVIPDVANKVFYW